MIVELKLVKLDKIMENNKLEFTWIRKCKLNMNWPFKIKIDKWKINELQIKNKIERDDIVL